MSKKIYTIYSRSVDEKFGGQLGIDEENNLYWNEKQIITKQEITLNKWTNCAIIATGIGTLLIALTSILAYLNISICLTAL
jgi:hypothetical protein